MNPIAPNKGRKINQAIDLYENFTGHEAEYVDNINYTMPDTLLRIGKVTGIMYETVRDNVKENYIHEFKKRSQPDLCVGYDGQQIILLGGNYLFKDDGINDI